MVFLEGEAVDCDMDDVCMWFYSVMQLQELRWGERGTWMMLVFCMVFECHVRLDVGSFVLPGKDTRLAIRN